MGKEAFRELVAASSKNDSPKLLLIVYRVEKLHDMNLTATGLGGESHWQIGSGILKDFDPDSNYVTVADANPTRYGDFWRCPIDHLHEALDLSDPKQDECGLIAISKSTGKEVKSTEQKVKEAAAAEEIKFGPSAF